MECVDVDIERAVRQLNSAMRDAAASQAARSTEGVAQSHDERQRRTLPLAEPLDAEDAAAIDALERLQYEPTAGMEHEATYAYICRLIDRVVAARELAPPAMRRLVDARSTVMGEDASHAARSVGYTMARTALDNLHILQSAQAPRAPRAPQAPQAPHPTTAFNETGQCPICYDDFGVPSSTTTTECGHKFCTDCWRRWESQGRSQVTCPLCGTVVAWAPHALWAPARVGPVQLYMPFR